MSFFKPRLEVMESRENPSITPIDPTFPGPSEAPPTETVEPAPAPATPPATPPQPVW